MTMSEEKTINLQHLWEKYQVDKSTRNRNLLVEANMGLVKSIAQEQFSKFTNMCNIDMDDLVMSGSLGLIYAVEKYDESRGSFSTLAYRAIRNRMINLVTVTNWNTGKSNPYNKNGKPTREVLEDFDVMAGDEEDPAIKVEMQDSILAAKCACSESEWNALYCYYYKKETLQEIADRLHVTRQRVDQLKTNGLNKIRRRMAEEYAA